MDPKVENTQDEISRPKSFKDLGLSDLLVGACRTLKWEHPTEVQLKSIPHILSDKDVVVIAETGCGKTGAYALPILHKLQQRPQRNFALILTPTMELALQVKEQISHLGAPIDARCVALVSKVDIADQARELGKKVHIIVATPGRLLDHLKQTTNFNFKLLKYLVLDEADKMLDMDFDSEIDEILQHIPKQRRTLLLSATLTTKVADLQRASLKEPVKVEVYNKHKTPQSLDNYYVCLPLTFREVYLVEVLRCLLLGNGTINKPCSRVLVFCNTCSGTLDIACMLAHLSFTAFPINGNMTKAKRIEMLDLYKQKKGSILVATDVASRGLDIPDVDAVVNLDLPNYPKEYVHRVGRTARAGRHGIAISFVTGDNISTYLSIERHVKRKFPLYPLEDRKILEKTWGERVSRAKRLALKEVNSFNKKQGLLGKKKSEIFDAEDDETEEAHGVKNRIKKKKVE